MATATVTAIASPRPATASPPRSATATAAALPPAASLRVDGGDPVTGQLGSYTWDGTGSDAPWLPGAVVTVGFGERLVGGLDPPTPIETWTARRVPVGVSDGAGAIAAGEGTGAPVRIDPLPRGSWSVQLAVSFSGERGSATYYWQVVVR